MKFISLLVILFSVSISDLREVYKSQDEDQVLAELKKLESKSDLNEDEQLYKSVFLCMKADYLTWPNEKLSAFKKGYAELNAVIKRNNSNAEYRYHRYMIEKHTPSWLIETNHMDTDRSFVTSNLKSTHPMYDFIIKTIDK